MRNKFLFSFAVCLFLFANIGGVLAEDIAYIAKDYSKIDSNIISLLENSDYTYEIIYQTALSSTNFSKYSVILVGDGNFYDYASNIPVNQKNSVILNSYHLEDWKWIIGTPSSLFSDSPRDVVVYDDKSLIVNGISTEFRSYLYGSSTENYQVDYLKKGFTAAGVKTIVADDLSLLKLLGIYTPKNGAVVASVNKGGQLLGGQTSQARGVYLGFPRTYLWTENVKQIFYNSIEWAIEGEDRDNDGFFGDEDCDDDNADVNPNGVEIPYDGIDQDCSGSDWNDLDEDGFIADFAGGDDCNDNDETYNINSTDPVKNCVNDAPIIDYMYTISVQETQIAEIEIEAEDPEGDDMTYSINDSRFTQGEGAEENIFSWQTDYDDAGYYRFNVTVSDGKLQSYKEVGVRVREKNQAPELLMDIPTQEWNEDTNHTLNLSSYFNDKEGDRLYYLIQSTSDNLGITISSIEDGTVYFTSQKDWFGEDWVVFKATDLMDSTQTNNITLKVLPVNDMPGLFNGIGIITMNEDETYYLNLEDYFYDVDSELEYSLQNTTHIILTLEGNTIKITPAENWYGEEEAEIKVDDEEFELNEKFTINVLSLNDAPDINTISDKFLLAGDKVVISASATDVEGDAFTFSMNDSRFVQTNENTFEWQTSEADFGVYNFELSAYDGDYGYENVKINVLQKIFINEFVWGSEGWIELYNPENLSFNMANCVLTNGEENIMLYGDLENKGFAAFGWNALKNNGYIELICNEILIDRVEYEEFNNQHSLGRTPDGGNNPFLLYVYPTKGVSNSADVTNPEVELISPANNTLYTETRDVLFEFSAKDNMAEELTCSIIANSKALESQEIENNTAGSFFIDYLQDGVYFWNVECSDGYNKNSALQSLMINISAPDIPVLNYIGNKVVSENNELKIYVYATDQDKDAIELRAPDIPEGASFTDNGNGNGLFVWTPNYNQSGAYNVKFFAKDATGLEDSETITILVGNTKEPPKFTDAEVCSKEDKSNLIEINIKEPDNGDDFEIGEVIEGEVKIKNNFEEDLDFDVEIYLYDIEEEEVIEDFHDSVDIDDGKSETVEFSFEIPKDIDNEDFAIYVYVESEDNKCNTNYVEIEVERKKHDVIIGEINLDKEVVSPGDVLGIEVKAENLGREDEEIFIIVEIPSFNLYGQSKEIKIEEYGEDDSETEIFTVLIPENTPDGVYEIRATVTFDNGNAQNSELKQFTVSKTVQAQEQPISSPAQINSIIKLNSQTTGSSLTLPTGSETPSQTALPLATGAATTTTPTTKPMNLRGSTFSTREYVIREKETLNVGVSEKTQKEYTPEVKVEFNDVSSTINKKISALAGINNWILLAVVLALLIIAIFVLILILK